MKKLIACPPGEWAKKLLTMDRFESIVYFLDEKEGNFGYPSFEKPVYNYAVLLSEEKDDIVIIVTDTHQYQNIKKKLMTYGLEENVHFFNGWKLDSNFYHIWYQDKNWQLYEQENGERTLLKHESGWKLRARKMSEMIPEDVKSIMDIGCGAGVLKPYLSAGQKYYGVDYCKRDDKTIICDINKEKLPSIKVDLYYLAGVVDYITNVASFIQQLKTAKYVLMSKTRNERFIRLDDKVLDSGYLNYGIGAYYISNLVSDMYLIGFVCEKIVWDYQDRDEYYLLFKNIQCI